MIAKDSLAMHGHSCQNSQRKHTFAAAAERGDVKGREEC